MSLSDPFAQPPATVAPQQGWAFDLQGMVAEFLDRLTGDARQDAEGKGFSKDPARQDYLRDIGVEIDF